MKRDYDKKPQQIEIFGGGLVRPYGLKFSDLEFKLSELCVLPIDDPRDNKKKEVLKVAYETALNLGFDYYLLRLDHTCIPVGVNPSSIEVYAHGYLYGALVDSVSSPSHISRYNRMVTGVKAAQSIRIGVVNYYSKKSKK